IGSMTRTVAAQTAGSSAQVPPPAAKKQEAAKDLSCTYYENGVGYAGTCGYDEKDKTKYRCYMNEDTARSNPQIACEWKVRGPQEPPGGIVKPYRIPLPTIPDSWSRIPRHLPVTAG